jgi:1-acyl-sn-glycerol-3-phosphate acyltransferase
VSRAPGAVAWWTSTYYLKPIARIATRARGYGLERIPLTGGCVLAINHIHWIDIPVVGAVTPRRISFVAKIEALRFPGFGRYIAWYGTIGIRRGETDRDAVRQMRAAAREGRALGIFVEGTRQHSGRPGPAQPGAAMISIQEGVPVVPIAVYGTQFWRIGNFAPCSIAVGEPVHYDGLPKGGRGYKEATADIERRILTLFDWLADVHRRGRPKGLTPPV